MERIIKSGDTIWVTNRKRQQKRCKVIDIYAGKVLTNISTELIPYEDISLEKLEYHSDKIRTTDYLEPFSEFEKQIFGRDHIAHHNRWTYVSKSFQIDNRKTLLDLGSGSGNLAMYLYKNKNKVEKYLGIEYSEKNIIKAIDKLRLKSTGKIPNWIEFKQDDLTVPVKYIGNWDYITCFEMIEHIGIDNAKHLLNNIRDNSNQQTIILISTPVYDHSVGAFEGHIINGEVNEFTYNEMLDLLSEDFEVLEHYGTFASMKDYKDKLDEHSQNVFDRLSKYYSSGELSWIFAPLIPKYSRNIIWKLKLKRNKNKSNTYNNKHFT